MNFYHVMPVSQTSYSRKWFVDGAGLEKVRYKYEHYNKNPDHIINRWADFKVKPVKKIWFDFGGMVRVGTPSVSEKIGDVDFELLVTHVPYLVSSLKNPRMVLDSYYWQCATRFNNYVFSTAVQHRLIEEFEKKENLYSEMIEGYEKEMDAAIANNPHVVSAKKYHRGNNDPTIIV